MLLVLALLTIAQGAIVRVRFLPSGSRVSARRARPLAVAAGLIAGAVAPFALHGHERVRYWHVAWHELAANPVLGSGAGTFADWWLRLRTVPQSTHEAHSLYLETLAELGPLGLALLLLALAAGVAGAWRLRREPLGPALLAALALVLVLGLDGLAAVALVPLAAEIALQQSTGTVAALALGLAAYLLTVARPIRTLGLLALPLVGALVVAGAGSVRNPPPTDLLVAAHTGHRVLLVLALLTIAQGVIVRARLLPSGSRVPARRARPLAVAAGLAAVAVAPFALRGHERARYWHVAWHELAANPVLGSGAGTFADWWLRLRTVPQSTHEAHSLYLETLAELGPLGLALLLLALAAGVAAAWRLRREPPGPALLAALITYDLAAGVDFHWELAAVTAPAIVLAASAVVHADDEDRLVPSRYAVPALAALTVAGVLALAGSSALVAGNPQRALRFAPYSSEAWKALAESRRASGDSAGALRAYRRAVKLDPNDWSAWAELAGLLNGEPRRLALAEAARLNPLGGTTTP